MELIYLLEFITLAETGSFSRTAEQLYISLPTLSRRILLLEEALGVTLFVRSTRRIELTESGRLLYPYARRILDMEAECREELRQEGLRFRYPLRLGCTPACLTAFTENYLADFLQKNANCQVNILEAGPETLVEKLLAEEADLAVMHAADCPENAGLSVQFSFPDVLCAVLPRNHLLAGEDAVALSTLAEESFLLPGEDAAAGGLARRACREAGFEPRVILTCSRTSALTELAAQGFGVALMMGRDAPGHGEDFVLRPVIPAAEDALVIAGGRKNPSFAARLFLRYVSDTLKRGEQRHDQAL